MYVFQKKNWKQKYFFLGFLVFPSAPIYVLTLKLDDLEHTVPTLICL